MASGLAPRWAAQQPHSTHRRYFRHTAPAGFGAASPPSAGQARSPQGRGQPVSFFGSFAADGCSTTGLLWPADFLWRAGLPRAGLHSSPTPNTVDISGTPRQQGLGRLRHPARGKPARHRDGGQPVRFFWKLRSGRREYYRTFVARRLLVASGLAPRWAAQQPHSRRRRYFWHTAPVGFGAASPPSAGQARSPQGGV